MIPVEKAREIILDKMPVLPAERVTLESALGRYLAEDIISTLDIPPFDNSAMDGYAVRTEDARIAGVTLEIASVLPAGSFPGQPVTTGQAVKIMTGAPIPEGADTVVRREDTVEEKARVKINIIPARHENIRFRGEDIPAGKKILFAGDHLGPAQIGLLASLRRPYVQVGQRPVVAVLATGDEIVELGEESGPKAIISSNSYTLISLIRSLGALPLYLGIARDQRSDLKARLSHARRCDLLLTSGGVSMGDYDMVREIMKEEGNALDFWTVDMKPGKPLAFGSLSGIPAIGLPGNPVSTMTSFYQFARPAILKMQGAREILLPRLRARLKEGLENKGDRPHYIRAILERIGDELVVSTTGPQGSGILSSMARGNCFIVLPKGITSLEEGSLVECEVFGGGFTLA
ncbi:MAG TPA: molybdopterin molybdotransferase MoeA [Deltaproteobacteria bacterium]|nr:molybdopterin molybdotransferase MoeA [Deltaproteobacteria bacterium]HPR53932.1 molybdopterin molybdotransferase MoeA [Deltaproteobacteria bacterium]HXK46732.1 molybdopterin molybdotransferase MoeA [Deltaproteobacteria bacterium]